MWRRTISAAMSAAPLPPAPPLKGEQVVRAQPVVRETLAKGVVADPADAAFVVPHQSRPGQDEAARAQPDQRHPPSVGPAQIGNGFGIDRLRLGQKPADDDDIVELRRVQKPGGGGDRDPAA
ncbi:hypothetical protein [Paracoccus yeei]|uniref:hypothetical protein n=1 Tax=Paracoccus yeei TaxID=147645 RepID=UPI0018F4D9DA|nr:hypothetical protein [Paracoccus yeei]